MYIYIIIHTYIYIYKISFRFSQAGNTFPQGIFGEFYVTPERYATMTGRGRDHAMYRGSAGQPVTVSS